MADAIIKTTARFQEAGEPVKQRPIIQVEQLPNTVRASMDSGRDNPFRPDGKIYRSADPIVDYYKHGANQSRTQSPTDSQLLLNGNQEGADQKRAKQKHKRGKHKSTNSEGQVESCWRRWCCCCCRCFRSLRCCRRSAGGNSTDAEGVDTIDATATVTTLPASEPTTKQPTKIVVLSEEIQRSSDEPTKAKSEQTKQKSRCSVS